MDDDYASQRETILSLVPAMADFLPPDPPERPVDLPLSSLRDLREWLREPANRLADRCLVVGWGDGSVVKAIADDPLLASKEIIVLVLAGERDSFAASFREPLLPDLSRAGVHLARLADESDLHAVIGRHFTDHHDIATLAGMDLVAGHPLLPAGTELRAELLPLLLTLLADRPSSLGNDIGDTYTGLHNAARNARSLLDKPALPELRGIFGRTPVISIAAGPSLSDHLDHLRELQDRCVLVACDAMLAGLLDAGIEPHFVTPLERIRATADMLQGADGTRTHFAGLPVVLPAGRDVFGERAVCIHAGDQLYDWLDPSCGGRLYCGSSTGVLSVSLALHLTDGPVYLVGHDLSTREGVSHCLEAEFAGSTWLDTKAQNDHQTKWQGGYEDRCLPGNAGEPVRSISWWARFRNEIIELVRRDPIADRHVYNLNARAGIGARIDGTLASDLPVPARLAPLSWPDLGHRHPERVADWERRARLLPDDAKSLQEHFRELRELVADTATGDPESWDVEGLAKQASLVEAVSEGNREAFAYFLRSALWNTEAAMHHHRGTANRGHARWLCLQAIEQLAHAVDNALTKLIPDMEGLRDDLVS